VAKFHGKKGSRLGTPEDTKTKLRILLSVINT